MIPFFDFHKAEKEALKKALQKVGVEPTEKLLARYSEINQAQWKKLELGELTQEEVKISRYRIFFERIWDNSFAGRNCEMLTSRILHMNTKSGRRA